MSTKRNDAYSFLLGNPCLAATA